MMTFLPQDAQAGAKPKAAKRAAYTVPSDISFPESSLWEAKPIDAAVGARLGYVSCSADNGCCHAAFYAIAGQMAEKYGKPYSDMPWHVMVGGRGGVGGWGSICGALLGAALAFSLFYQDRDHKEMVRELFHWYNNASLPMYRPGVDVYVDKDIPQSVSGSVLCHISNAKWAYASGYRVNSKERSERCARLTADVAHKAIEILNAKIAGTFDCSVKAIPTPRCDAAGNVEYAESTGDAVILVRKPEFRALKVG